ncbi:Uncharacterized protein YjbK [Alteribacillus persepolensis]|uniref:Uncharacterized protein YjbK n=2 Tax=Alteribacillus persepolensis TaxID=568899 RepID=A0A1G8EQ79_9BACI|nr:Uncharacterized protein YjbK [Alteribacillus persepolensis]
MEKKNLLTKTEFDALCDAFHIKENDFFWQANTYFDTKDFALKQKGAALRIREKNGQYELTLKQPASKGLLETNQALSKETAESALTASRFPDGEVKTQLKTSLHLSIEEVTPLGTLKTKRTQHPYRQGLLFLDHSTYLDVEDYEVEMEGPSLEQVNNWLEELLSQFHIPTRTTPNKIKRFFTRQEEIQAKRN